MLILHIYKICNLTLTEATNFQTAMSNIYYIVLITFAGVFGLVAVVGYISSKYVVINDYFSVNSIFSAMCHSFDLISDISICIAISEKIMDKDIYFWLFVASLIFIILPIMVSMAQLLHQINKHWIKDEQTKLWLRENSKKLFLLSFLFGSSFTSIGLMNSNLFQLYWFSMGLSKEQYHRYMAKSIYSIVILEVLSCHLYLLRVSVSHCIHYVHIYRIFPKWQYK